MRELCEEVERRRREEQDYEMASEYLKQRKQSDQSFHKWLHQKGRPSSTTIDQATLTEPGTIDSKDYQLTIFSPYMRPQTATTIR